MNKPELYREILNYCILSIRSKAGVRKQYDEDDSQRALNDINELTYLIHHIPKI